MLRVESWQSAAGGRGGQEGLRGRVYTLVSQGPRQIREIDVFGLNIGVFID